MTSLTPERPPSNDTSRYLPLRNTQCAAVSTRSGAIATPVHRTRPPTIRTTWRAIARSASGAPPTNAPADEPVSTRQTMAASARGSAQRAVPGLQTGRGKLRFPAKLSAPATGAWMQLGLSIVRGSLPRGWPRVPLFLLKKRLLDLVMDPQEPCLGARGAIAKVRRLGFELPHSFFGSSQLK